MVDIIVVGSGPAGLSAAITARMRGKSVTIIGNSSAESGLAKAAEIGNYPGLPGLSGAELSGKMLMHAVGMGAEHVTGRVTTILPVGRELSVSYGSEIATGASLILATGVVQSSVFPGEAELLGRGVSYCATCDGMLYKGKKVCVVCLSPDAEEEANFLESIGCRVTRLKTKKIKVNGEDKVTSVTADGNELECDGVFILRATIAPTALLPGLETDKGHIKVDRAMKTNIPGVFAAGDCTGTPYQVAKAAGEGQIAVLSAVEYLAHR
ncbi:thioredoxin reductase (NADPH) [Sporobacter termitidis DSM 10068]|uniref:Thioredoxin reductase (NADPH) n=1 Tax=Sporobacter termitidis DSM 10068 TaxID=1123282 RepID=A0A1M5VK48_9FIRM|nr:NAD(P)/FAD-dependent oxidoreductase [Sporobacter termitidis]SHH75629.1 thioredoxin reductase (NADPH) [Sporobacter termitidis DSM 10068]